MAVGAILGARSLSVNGVATVLVAKCEGEQDKERMAAALKKD
ncbi:MAG: hypothetical protein ACOVVK_08260 [Elsteraceae bacterium]